MLYYNLQCFDETCMARADLLVISDFLGAAEDLATFVAEPVLGG